DGREGLHHVPARRTTGRRWRHAAAPLPTERARPTRVQGLEQRHARPDSGVRSMTLPGTRLRALAARIFGQHTMDRLIDPIVADLQTEYADATRRGRVWRSRWIRLAGCVAFLKAASLYACQNSLGLT